VSIEGADGSIAVFVVERIARYAKDEFPTLKVYTTNGTELRLITCGGEFDDSAGSYPDNVVVFASLAQVL
jgi:hypothetical protein